MIKAKGFIKYFIAIFILILLYFCIWGIPLKNARTTVKNAGTDMGGAFTGMWSPVKGKDGIFISEEGWIFEGEINPDGGLWNGELRNYPMYRLGNYSGFPEGGQNSLYTVTIEECVVIDVKPE